MPRSRGKNSKKHNKIDKDDDDDDDDDDYHYYGRGEWASNGHSVSLKANEPGHVAGISSTEDERLDPGAPDAHNLSMPLSFGCRVTEGGSTPNPSPKKRLNIASPSPYAHNLSMPRPAEAHSLSMPRPARREWGGGYDWKGLLSDPRLVHETRNPQPENPNPKP